MTKPITRKDQEPEPRPQLNWRPADDEEGKPRHTGETHIEHEDREGTRRREPEEPHRESEAV